MSQTYFPKQTISSRVSLDEAPKSFAALQKDVKQGEGDVQRTYLEHKDRLAKAIDSTKSILNDLQKFNRESWIIRYPNLGPPMNGSLQRSMSSMEDPVTEVDTKPRVQHSVTLSPEMTLNDNSEQTSVDAEVSPDFHVLRLDLKLGPPGSSAGPATLVSQLEKASISNLIDERIISAMKHIEKLKARIEDTSSKVLVTGDLNAGKSTFVNAVLRKQVMPVDQQPCTTMFCEVHDAAENGGIEEVHIIKEGVSYDITDPKTYIRVCLEDLENVVGENENVQQVVRIYVQDSRDPRESLLHNGVVDIALIDAPGLNRDSLKTTALFARQEEIDVVVFVVSAENHFTLSAKEFLWNASNEKAYLFIVVNRFDQIRDKEKCKRLVLEQIKQLSPRTFEDAEDLVHFVDSGSVQTPDSSNALFENLETSLRSFVLVKRAKSKLHPASTYLSHLLADIDLLSSCNTVVAQSELDQAKDDLGRIRPVLEKMKKGREDLEDGLENIEDGKSNKAGKRTKEILHSALERVGNGLPGAENIKMPSYSGLLSLWEYVRDVRRTLLESLDIAVNLAQDDARLITSNGVKEIAELGEKHLPPEVERSKRIFMPERMFLPKKGGKQSHSTVVAGGIHGLGLGLAQRSEMLECTALDICDVQHYLSLHFIDNSKSNSMDEDTSATALSIVSVGIGALTMVGGKTLGMRGVLEGIVRLTDIFENETVRKWAAPVVGALTVGLTAYFIVELPNTIPRTVGRRIKSSLVLSTGSENEDTSYINTHAQRITRETRKVLRMASWDLKERFRVAMDERAKDVKNAEEIEKKANYALMWFTEVGKRTADTRKTASLA